MTDPGIKRGATIRERPPLVNVSVTMLSLLGVWAWLVILALGYRDELGPTFMRRTWLGVGAATIWLSVGAVYSTLRYSSDMRIRAKGRYPDRWAKGRTTAIIAWYTPILILGLWLSVLTRDRTATPARAAVPGLAFLATIAIAALLWMGELLWRRWPLLTARRQAILAIRKSGAHDVQILHFEDRHGLPAHQVACSCGWVGVEREDPGVAERDLSEHRASRSAI